jgi:prevent-host-death family protein
MSKTVSSTEAKNQFGSIVLWVLEHKDEVVVESHGEPKVVIISFAEYQQIKEIKEQRRRQEVLARLEDLRTRVRARNQDLTADQADDLADQIGRDIVEDMRKSGRVRFGE